MVGAYAAVVGATFVHLGVGVGEGYAVIGIGLGVERARENT